LCTKTYYNVNTTLHTKHCDKMLIISQWACLLSLDSPQLAGHYVP